MKLPAAPGPSLHAERDAAMARSYPVARMVDGGAREATAQALHAAVSQGLDWIQCSRWLAARIQQEALATEAAAPDDGEALSAIWRDAAACHRFAQAAQDEDTDDKLADYLRHGQAFERAMRHLPQPVARLQVPGNEGPEPWLFLPAAGAAPPVPAAPCVLVFGGADGWCEALYPTVPAMLAQGLAVCLCELPGQGLTRLQSGRYLDAGFPSWIARILDALARQRGVAPRFGVCGHSLGGSFAVVAAGAEPRFAACCSNSGAAWPAAAFQSFPRVLDRVARMVGGDRADAARFLDALDIPGHATRMRARLLCLHGGRDTLFSQANVEALMLLRGVAQALIHVWPDGGHCLYSHRTARNDTIARWFAQTLEPAAIPSPGAAGAVPAPG